MLSYTYTSIHTKLYQQKYQQEKQHKQCSRYPKQLSYESESQPIEAEEKASRKQEGRAERQNIGPRLIP